jgi:hypothetical protein
MCAGKSQKLFPVQAKLVGAVRFELTTSCTRNKRATRLRYAPTREEEVAGDYCKLQLNSAAELRVAVRPLT